MAAVVSVTASAWPRYSACKSAVACRASAVGASKADSARAMHTLLDAITHGASPAYAVAKANALLRHCGHAVHGGAA